MKATIIGAAGHVGSLAAFSCLMQHDMIMDLDLIDIDKSKLEAQAADLRQAIEVQGIKRDVCTVESPKESDIYIMAIGEALPNAITDRSFMYSKHKPIVLDYAKAIAKVRKEHSTLLMVTNPSAALAKDAMEYLPFVISVGNLLDNARYRMCCITGPHEKPDIQERYLEVKSAKGYTSFGVVSEIMQYIRWFAEGFHRSRW